MPLTKFQPRPGLVRDTTSYANEGGWYYSDKIRFRLGFPERIGGWVRFATTTFLGTCNALLPWVSLNGTNYMATGTNLKLYISSGSVLNDITPIRRTASPLVNNPFSTLNNSTTVTVTDALHGAQINDFVTFSGTVGTINGVPITDLNKELQVTNVIDVNTYTVAVATTAIGTGAGGGATVTAVYQIYVGLALYVPGIGWGVGGWGVPAWGTSTTITVAGQIRLWALENFGEDLVFCDLNGALYYWDATTGTSVRAVLLSSLSGASDVPTIATTVLVTPSRFVVALGCNQLGSSTQDPLFVRWTDQESAVNWTPTATNSAGGLRLSIGSTIVAAENTRQETLVWTDTTLYSMQYIGGELVFSFTVMANFISIIGPNAVSIVGSTAYWLGRNKFYMYNGVVNTLDCPLRHILETNMNPDQGYQVFAGTNELYTEITWFYCSINSVVIDSYITYNYGENLWYFGTMARSAWVDAGINPYPTAADVSNKVLLSHEVGLDDVSTGTAVAITAYIESSDIDLGDGHNFMFINRVIPDISFEGSTATSPAVTLTIKTRASPGGTWNSNTNEPAVQALASTGINGINVSPIETFTQQLWPRLRGRQTAMRIESTALGVKWRLGALRFDVRPDGRR